jgi:hypothetical protein
LAHGKDYASFRVFNVCSEQKRQVKQFCHFGSEVLLPIFGRGAFRSI